MTPDGPLDKMGSVVYTPTFSGISCESNTATWTACLKARREAILDRGFPPSFEKCLVDTISKVDLHDQSRSLFIDYQEVEGLLSGTAEPRYTIGSNIHLELWMMIFGHLDVNDIKNVRLASRKWTGMAVPFLFSKMSIYPDRPDVQKLLLVAKDRMLKCRIKKLTLSNVTPELGVIGSEYPGETCDAEDKDCRLWRQRVHKFKRPNLWDPETLTQIFTYLRKLDIIEVGLLEPFIKPSDPYWSAYDWHQYSSRNDDAEKERVRRFSVLLQCLRDTKLRLRCLKVENLTPRFFEQRRHAVKHWKGSLDYLEVLDLSVDPYWPKDWDYPLFLNNVAFFICSIPQLKEIRLCFNDGSLEPETGRLLPRPVIEYTLFSLSQFIGSNKWPALESVAFSGTMLRCYQLMTVLELHRVTLTKVELDNICIVGGSFKQLFSFCRETLDLSRFTASGILKKAEILADGNIDKFLWVKVSSKLYDLHRHGFNPDLASTSVAAQFQSFVLDNGVWPLTACEGEIDEREVANQIEIAIKLEEVEPFGPNYDNRVKDIIPIDASGKPLDLVSEYLGIHDFIKEEVGVDGE